MRTKLITKLGITIAMIALLALSAVPGYASTLYNTAVSYWNFDEGSGSYANDTAGTGNANTGTLTNKGGSGTPTWTTGYFGGALSFDQSKYQYVNVPIATDLQISGSMTFSAWIYPIPPQNQGYGGVIQDVSGLLNGRLLIGDDGSTLVQFITSNNNYSFYGPAVTNNAWNNIVYMVDTTAHKEYIIINGNVAGEGVYNGATFTRTGSSPLQIGQGHSTSGYSFNGKIDEVAIWSSVLSTTQIDALYKEGFIYNAVKTGGAFGLGYNTDKANQLAALYAAQTGTTVIDGTTWRYVTHEDPIWDQYGTRTIGETFTVNGVKYLYLGGGLDYGDPAVPEPATVAGVWVALIVIGYRRFRK